MIEMRPSPQLIDRSIVIGEQTTFSNGARAEAIIENPLERRKASGKSKHEVIHGLMDASNVSLIDIDPTDEPGADAVTYFKTIPNEEAMAGPDAMGMDGTGFDMHQLALRGASAQGARLKARMKMKQMEKYLDPAADYVEYHRSISGGQLLKVMDRVDNGNDVRIKITNPDGTVEQRTVRGVDFYAQTVEVPMDERHWYDIKPNSENDGDSVDEQPETINSIERFLYGDPQEDSQEDNEATLNIVDEFLKDKEEDDKPEVPDTTADGEAIRDVRAELKKLEKAA